MRMPQSGRRVTLTTLALGLLFILAAVPTVGQSADEARLRLSVSRSYLPRARDGARIMARVWLDSPADLRLRVLDADGRTVRELFAGHRAGGSLSRSWDGRDEDGRIVPEGPYRIAASSVAVPPAQDDRPAAKADPPAAESVGQVAGAWVTVADRRVYPPRPGFITIAIDPGHGGLIDGAVGRDGTREADLNLDIGLRLARMLEGAGVAAVVTRTSDSHVNEPPLDLTGDGLIDETDELAARPDVANRARADLFIAIHNNTAVNESTGGPSTFYVEERTFGHRSARLARAIQEAMVAAIGRISAGDWLPYDHGALIYPYYVLRDYDPPRLLRPTQMPGVLSEGLFLSNPRELRLLKQPRVRQAMAVAYYHAIAEYLAGRESHVGYASVASSIDALRGETVAVEVEVRNQGTEPMRGWRLAVSAVPAPSGSVGRPGGGQRVGERRIPFLAPGRRVRLDVQVTAPEPAQPWTLLFDATDPDGRRASELGSPPLEVQLTTVEPALPPPSAMRSRMIVSSDLLPSTR
jgi:N-acetylmuramoyl-L-alanine amidase